MLISYHGHSEFYLESADGFALLTDPYDRHVGYPMHSWRADGVTVSHGHSDHNDVSKALGTPALVDGEGVWMLSPEVKVTAIPSFHDDAQGTKRGNNLIMRIEMDGLVLAHLGDLGEALSPAQQKALGRVDILLVPVGGYYTIDAQGAKAAVDALQPRMIIPMHYKTAVNADWPIAGPEPFLQLMDAAEAAPIPLLRVTRGDLSQQPRVAYMAWDAGK